MKSIQTEINIKAPVKEVWKVLMNFEEYPEWNPFIHVTGQAREGHHLMNTIVMENAKPQVFKPKVLKVIPHQEFRWKGKLLFKGLFDGVHFFKLEKIDDDNTRFIHGEYFKGILVPVIWKMVGQKTEKGFQRMNKALKIKCEKPIQEKINP